MNAQRELLRHLTLLVLLLIPITFASAEEASNWEHSFDSDASFASKYLFLGQDLSEGKPVIQPEAGVTVNNFMALVWLNYDVDTEVTNEVDVYLQYGWELDKLSLSPGYAYYEYPNRDWDSSQEILLDASLDVPGAPSLSYHYDFDAGDGSYTTLGFGHELQIGSAPVSVGTNLFYLKNYYDATGFSAMELNTSYGHPIGASTITGSLSYFPTWKNGDFRDDLAVESTWLFSINIAQSY